MTCIIPKISSRRNLPQFNCPICNPKMRINFKCARLYTECSCLDSWSGMAINDHEIYAMTCQLIGQHQSSWSSTNNQYISLVS